MQLHTPHGSTITLIGVLYLENSVERIPYMPSKPIHIPYVPSKNIISLQCRWFQILYHLCHSVTLTVSLRGSRSQTQAAGATTSNSSQPTHASHRLPSPHSPLLVDSPPPRSASAANHHWPPCSALPTHASWHAHPPSVSPRGILP